MPDATLSRTPAASALAAAARGLRARPRVAAVGGLWLLGLFLAFLAPAPVAITKQAAAAYDLAAADAARAASSVAAAERAAVRARLAADAATPWFWRLKGADVRAAVHAARARADAADAELEARLAKTDAALRRGKAALGLWSDAGVGEARALYRSAFDAGRVFGRRQTFWDGLMRLLSSREERHPAVVVVELVLTAVANFSIGAAGSVFIFAASLPRLIASYQASLLSAIFFYALATLAAASVAVAFIGALAASGTAAAYSVVSLAGGRLEAGPRRANVYNLPPRARPRAPGGWRDRTD